MSRVSPVRRFVPVLALSLLAGGCVSELEREAASRRQRPEMPRSTLPPRLTPVATTEERVRTDVRGLAEAREFAAASRLLERMEDASRREQLAREVTLFWIDQDPRAAVAWAQALTPGAIRDALLPLAARAAAQRDAESAVAWAISLGEPDGPQIRRIVAQEVAGSDPRGGLQRLQARPEETGRDEMIAEVALVWMRHDAAAGMAWLRGIGEVEARERLTARIGFALAQFDPMRAVALAESLAPGRNRWLLHTAIAETWVAVDARAAHDWARQLPPGEARQAALAGLDAGLGVAVGRRRAIAADLRRAENAGSGSRMEAERGRGDEAGFAAWRETQPVSVSREEAVLAYVRQRGAQEPERVGQWVAGLPGGATREQAVEAFLETLVTVAPSEAASWLSRLPRSEQSPARIERTAREWMRRDPEAANAWLRDQPLPAGRP